MDTAIALTSAPPATADDLLIQRVLSGDEEAFASIVTKYQKKIFRTALAILRDELEADGVTHDTFVQAYLKLGGFEGRAGLETWLTRIAINKARDVLRRRRWVSLSAPGSDDGEPEGIQLRDERPDAERLAAAAELSEAIEEAVSTLSVQQKLIFTLRHFENRSLEEIAALLDVRAGTVRAHLFRAVHKVRARLAPWWSGARMSREETE